MSTSAIQTGDAAGRSTSPSPLLRSTARVRSSDDRNLDVNAVLAMSPRPDDVEVYVGWTSEPVRVSLRRGADSSLKWEQAAPLLRARVLTALDPLRLVGWHMNGAFTVAVRWDMSHGEGGDLYEGCWVRLRG